jgi:hypothetical protein
MTNINCNQSFFSLAQPPWALASDFCFMFILQMVGLLGRVISSSQGLYLNIRQHKHGINIYTHQTSMPYVGFEPTIPAISRPPCQRRQFMPLTARLL